MAVASRDVVQHVALETAPANLAEAVEFWRLLGFEPVEPPESLRQRATWLERRRTQIHLLHTDSPVAPRDGHVAVVAEDYDATLERLRDAGHVPEARPEHWGAPRAFVRSPGGHRVELMSAPPPSHE